MVKQPPNVLLLLADDMTFSDLGCYGNPDVETPNLDRLAAAGLRFRNCFNSSAMCAPTRMSLYTGIHPVRNGAWPNHSRVYDHVRSLPHHLQSAGYKVALLGKRHEAPLENFPFEHLGGRHHDNGTGVALPLNLARQFMKVNKDNLWCLVVANNQPHTPWNRGNAAHYVADDLQLPPYMVDTPELRTAMTKYYAEITYMDAQVGQCLKYLDETGQQNRTLVLFLSEQGSQIPFGKWTCYEMGLRSAAIARWPGVIPAGSTSDALIQYVDVVPTLMEIIWNRVGTQFDPQDQFDGKSFAHVLKTPAASHHAEIFGLHTTVGVAGSKQPYGIRTVRTNQHRLVWNLQPDHEFDIGGWRNFAPLKSWQSLAESGQSNFASQRVKQMRSRPEYELFDIQQDPWCLNNLADKPESAEIMDQLSESLKKWMAQQNDNGAETELAGAERRAKKRKQ